MKMKLVSSLLLGSSLFFVSADSDGVALAASEPVSSDWRWNLNDIYADEAAWRQDAAALKSLLPKLAAYKGHLQDHADSLPAVLQLKDEIGQKSSRLYAYARLHRDLDNADSRYQSMTSEMEALLAEAGAASAFIEPELLEWPAGMLEKKIQADARLAPYTFDLRELERQKPHVLSQKEEELMARFQESFATPATVFNMLARADMRFPETLTDSGEKLPLSEARYNSLIRSPQREVRKEAFEALFTTYRSYRNTLASTLSGTIKNHVLSAKARHYDSSLDASLSPHAIPATVYDGLIDTIHEHLPALHRFVQLKKQALELEEIHMYDLYAPVGALPPRKISYPDAQQLVKSSLTVMGPAYLEQLDQAFASRWLDVPEGKNKQSGAYSWGIYGVHPFILLNYQGRSEDVSTLTHELGHAMHSYYSQKQQPYATSAYTIFCAEVASTTNEILLLNYLLAQTTDRQERIALLHQYLEQVRATVFRQTLFAEFERTVHKQMEQGQPQTADSLSKLWLDLNRQYYGPDLVLDECLDIEWGRIPHFYRPFYVYQYATGYAAATALAHGLSSGDPQAQTRYLKFLHSGGSDHPVELLRQAGVDMSTPQPVEVTMAHFSSRLAELEQLLSQQP